MHPLLKIDGCICTLCTRYYDGPAPILPQLTQTRSWNCKDCIISEKLNVRLKPIKALGLHQRGSDYSGAKNKSDKPHFM